MKDETDERGSREEYPRLKVQSTTNPPQSQRDENIRQTDNETHKSNPLPFSRFLPISHPLGDRGVMGYPINERRPPDEKYENDTEHNETPDASHERIPNSVDEQAYPKEVYEDYRKSCSNSSPFCQI